ncbi:serine hydrolase domain-containing protein [Streptomyces mirabilis]|uniref:serine hydrolase domain-containing protein n=1 Tax=Streptomyces mirabilis TaxID=68239 RepID=UPI00399D69A2
MVLRWSVDHHRPGVTTRRHRKVSPVTLQELLDKQDSYGAPAVLAGLSAAKVRSVATRGAVRVSPDSCFRIASLTKVFTCTALVETMQDNSIPLGTAVIELLPDLAPGWRADVRLAIEQILGQVSGLRESVGSTALAALDDGPRALQEAAELVAGTGNEHEPGARWSYCNGNYILAGAVLAALSGTSYERAVEKTLLGPWNGLRSRMGAQPFRPDVSQRTAAELSRSDAVDPRRGLRECCRDQQAAHPPRHGNIPQRHAAPLDQRRPDNSHRPVRCLIGCGNATVRRSGRHLSSAAMWTSWSARRAGGQELHRPHRLRQERTRAHVHMCLRAHAN